MRALIICLSVALAFHESALNAAEKLEGGWRALPLIKDGRVAPDWVHIGVGRFAVEEGALRTEPAGEGLGLLVYKKEKFGNCQLRITFKPKDERSNSGFYIRLDDGILKQVNNLGAKFVRDEKGNISTESMERMKASSEREDGIWYGVHHGFEVQIAGGGDSSHGTAAIYSLANTSAKPKPDGLWRTMVVTLVGTQVFVDLNGERVTAFDSEAKDLPPRKQWYEPKREHKRPEKGYIGLQTHDPGDVVWFKEVAVRPLPAEFKPAK